MCVRRGWGRKLDGCSGACRLKIWGAPPPSPLNLGLLVHLYARLPEMQSKQGSGLLVGHMTLKLYVQT
jgi:hypothetical protein